MAIKHINEVAFIKIDKLPFFKSPCRYALRGLLELTLEVLETGNTIDN